MECKACGYRKIDLDHEVEAATKDGFIEIGGTYTRKKGPGKGANENITLYACPNCGTVRID